MYVCVGAYMGVDMCTHDCVRVCMRVCVCRCMCVYVRMFAMYMNHVQMYFINFK